MWFSEQLNTFLNLGECKEYPIMARPKSIPGSKTNRVNNNANKEQPGAGNQTNLPEVKVAAETSPAAVSPELKVTPAASVATASKATSEPKAAAEPKPTSSEGRKFEVVKNDSRKNVVPINLEDEIRRRAYELFQQRGPGSGSEAEDWLTAEREVRQRYHKQSA
jgi:Protein of unknown function (DUF2934)